MQIWSSEIKELEALYTSIKGQFPDLEKELEQLIETKDANVVMLYSRRCLEIIVTDLCECELKRPRRTEPLKGIIDKLNHEEKVPAHIITSMHGLNDLATFGAHPKEFDPQQVRPVLINLTTIIKWYLKYKDSQTISEIKTEGEQHDIKSQFVSKEIIRKPKRNLVLLLSVILVVVVIIVYPKIFKRDTQEKLQSAGERICVAIMPFQNMTNDTIWNVWQDGIQNELINILANAEELQVRQSESVNTIIQGTGLTNYASITPSVASNISQKLDANVFVNGSIKQVDTTIRLNARLVDSKTEDVLKSFQIDGTAENILHMIDSLSLMVKNFLIISELEKENTEFRTLTSTNSPEAYRYYILGKNAYYNLNYQNAINWFNKACEIDTNFTWAMWFLSVTNRDFGFPEESKKWAIRLYKKKDMMPEREKLWVCCNYAEFFQLTEAISYLRQLEEYDNQFPIVNIGLGWTYLRLQQYDNAIREYEKAFEIYDRWGSKPGWALYYQELGFAYHNAGQYKKEKKLYKKAELDFPDDPSLIFMETVLSLSEGNKRSTRRNIERYISACKYRAWTEADIAGNLAEIYSKGGIPDKAEEYYRQALLLEPENPVRLNALAYFLIDKERNINEGLELIDKAFQSSPDVYYMMDTKGWGLYKQGKYQEALEILQKSWNIRREKASYNHEAYLHLEAAKKVVANQKK